MRYQCTEGIRHIHTAAYALAIKENCIDVIVAGEVIAGMRPVSAIATVDTDGIVHEDVENGSLSFAELCEDDGTYTYIWTSSSTLWVKKEYILRCLETRFEYFIQLTGTGAVESVAYFSGDKTAPKAGSMYEFDQGFYPVPTVDGAEQMIFSAQRTQRTFSYLMVPPLFCYSFSTPGIADKLAFGLVAKSGEHNFTQFDYVTKSDANCRRFWFETDQAGHVFVSGTWKTPCIVGYTAPDDLGALRAYSEVYFDSGIAPRRTNAPVPQWWHGPICCGWIEQYAYGLQRNEPYSVINLACERVYLNFRQELARRHLHPTIMIIDDKWQKQYGTGEENPDQWQNMRGFIDDNLQNHGIHTMLWFKLWDSEGLDAALCMYDPKEKRMVVDSTNPKYRRKLKEILYHLLSADAGCLNADGLKLDYAFCQPVGREAHSFTGLYGVELFLELIRYIYTCVKEIKPEAIVNCSPCHPLFAPYMDHARLHDYYPDLRRSCEEFQFRRDVYSIAAPGVLIDTDGAAFSSYRDTMRYLRFAPQIGIPDLYCITPMPSLTLTDNDWKEISKIWEAYHTHIESMYIER